MPVSHESPRFSQCVFGLSSWLSTRSSTFSVFSLTYTERGMPLPGCRSIVSTRSSDFLQQSVDTSTFWALIMSLSGRYLDWKNLCVNKILFNVIYSQKNMLLTAKFVIFLCSVISQGKVVALDRWGGKWNHRSMTPRLTTDYGYAKNYCNRTLIVKVIVENVVTCFFMGHSVVGNPG